MNLLRIMTRKLKDYFIFFSWIKGGYPIPAPNSIKWKVLLRHGGQSDSWIETGTYLGQTTRFLAKHSKHVISIEPSKILFENVLKTLRKFKNITLLNGTSEELLGVAIEKILSSNHEHVCFWLDGHFSAGNTFKGETDTPILSELKTIKAILGKLHVTIFIDDVRCFSNPNQEYTSYPKLSELTEWAENSNFSWLIEHDILIFKSH
jgi:hypothetical protein